MFTKCVTVVNYTGGGFGKEAVPAKFFVFGNLCGSGKGGRCPLLKLLRWFVRVVLCKPLRPDPSPRPLPETERGASLVCSPSPLRGGGGGRGSAQPGPGALKEDRVTATSLINLGFLTVLHEANGYLGGYLVTNNWGRPLEF